MIPLTMSVEEWERVKTWIRNEDDAPPLAAVREAEAQAAELVQCMDAQRQAMDYALEAVRLGKVAALKALTLEQAADELKAASRAVVARMTNVYRSDYVARCEANEPDSLLALVARLKEKL